MKSVLLLSLLLFHVSLASADAAPEELSAPSASQQADSQPLGACFIGQPGNEVCAEIAQQDCNGLGALWREGKCPPPDFPPVLE